MLLVHLYFSVPYSGSIVSVWCGEVYPSVRYVWIRYRDIEELLCCELSCWVCTRVEDFGEGLPLLVLIYHVDFG